MVQRADHRSLATPGLLFGAYPERFDPRPGAFSQLLRQAGSALAHAANLRTPRLRAFVAAVGALDAKFAAMGPAALREFAQQLRGQLSHCGLSEELLTQSFALIRALAVQELGLRPFDTQLMAARVMLDNRLAEMATGEGKTLAAAICAASAALAGIPVHVVTVNDYLVARDAQWLAPLYESLGLRVGHVVAELDSEARRIAYGCDITYCTAKELVFDYLRDRVLRGPRQSDLQLRAARLRAGDATAAPLLRGLCMAIVDEADSVLIDEARVPLILARSATNAGECEHHRQALEMARCLRVGVDYQLDAPRRSARLTEQGLQRVETLSEGLSGVWLNRSHCEQTLCTALSALHLYRNERDYLVHDGAVVIVDEATGRLAPGRVWSRGLHQLIELKEGLEPTGEQVTAAQITYQRYFARYLRLAGMSGTLREARSELSSVYGLDVVKIALRRADRRVSMGARLVRDRRTQLREVSALAQRISGSGRPVLIGTDSVADSESLSLELARAGLAHQVLNARHDQREAQIVAQAGQSGRITVATNMAGRGTDIALGQGVAELGGLHVICCQHNAARRIDRQLIGRCARQGDPGSAQTLVALDSALMATALPSWLRKGLGRLEPPSWLVRLLLRVPQWRQERQQRAQRRALQRQDLHAERELFAGMPGE